MVKNLPVKWEMQVPSLGWEDPWRRKWQTNPVFLPGKSQRRLAGYTVHEVARVEQDSINNHNLRAPKT